MSTFALELAAFAELAQENAREVIRRTALEMASAVILRSPVGNPELWAANIAYRANATASADAYDYNVSIRNTIVNLTESNFTKKGNLRKGVKYAKPLTKTERVQNFDVNGLVSGKNYVGGRFRGNWQVSFDARSTTLLDTIDPTGNEAIANARLRLAVFNADVGSIWFMNSLPYGPRLEYQGWSDQAPAGMVRITVEEFQTFVNRAVAELQQ